MAAAFDGFAQRRTDGGVRAARIAQPVDDQHYIVIDLDFATTEEAATFLASPENTVWASASTAPALAGRRARPSCNVPFHTWLIATYLIKLGEAGLTLLPTAPAFNGPDVCPRPQPGGASVPVSDSGIATLPGRASW